MRGGYVREKEREREREREGRKERKRVSTRKRVCFVQTGIGRCPTVNVLKCTIFLSQSVDQRSS